MASAIGASDWLVEVTVGILAQVALVPALVEVIWKFIAFPEVLTDWTWTAQELESPLPPGTGMPLGLECRLAGLEGAQVGVFAARREAYQ